MAIKILATADIHIGKSSSGVSGGGDSLATRSTWSRIVEWAIQNEVDVLALSGDIVDHDNQFFEAIGPLKLGFEKLAASSIQVFITAGNHDFDVLPQLINARTHPNVHLLGSNGQWSQQLFEKNGQKIRFVGWSFKQRHQSDDPLRAWDVTLVDDGTPVVGLVHGDMDNPESRYAPISTAVLRDKPVDLWILGHIHKPQTIQDRDPKIFYPGSPHALSAKETGAHGPVLITVRSKNDFEVSRIPLSPVRYESLEIDVTGTDDFNSLRTCIYNAIDGHTTALSESLDRVEFLIYDLVLSGVYPNLNELNNCLLELRDTDNLSAIADTQVQVRNISVTVGPGIDDMESLASQSSPVGILARSVLALKNGETTPFLDAVIPEWKRQYHSLVQAPVYHDIKLEVMASEPNDEAKKYIEQECNRLLIELMKQQS